MADKPGRAKKAAQIGTYITFHLLRRTRGLRSEVLALFSEPPLRVLRQPRHLALHQALVQPQVLHPGRHRDYPQLRILAPRRDKNEK